MNKMLEDIKKLTKDPKAIENFKEFFHKRTYLIKDTAPYV